MMENVTTRNIIEQLGNTPVTVSPSLGEVDPLVAAQFASLLKTSSQATHVNMTTAKETKITEALPNIVTQQTMTSALPPLSQTTTLPSSPLLGALNDFSNEYEKNIATVKQTLASQINDGDSITDTHVLEIQKSLLENSAAVALASKIAGSLTSSINQLVKTQ